MAMRPQLAEAQTVQRMEEEDYGVPALAGGASIAMNAKSFIMTAQPVAVKRKIAEIRRQIAEYCAVNGPEYTYSWKVNNREKGTKDTIDGPTIKLANDLARIWGNCLVGIVDVVEAPDHWVFHAGFIDLETGANYIRPFRQRRNQSLGMGARERDREQDIIFQVGASKAIRNVVVNALSSEARFAVEEAKRGLINYIEKYAAEANAFVDTYIGPGKFEQKRVEGFVGRLREKWTNRDMAQVIANLKQVEAGYERLEELFPPIDVAEARIAADAAQTTANTSSAVKKAEDKKAEAEGQTKAATEGDGKKEEMPDVPDNLKRGKKKAKEESTPAQTTAPAATVQNPDTPAEEGEKPEPTTEAKKAFDRNFDFG